MSQSRDVAYDVVGAGSNSPVTVAYQSVLKDLKASAGTIRLPHRLMLLVADGLPYDPEYESAYAEADVHKALGEARAADSARLCLCVDSATDIHKLHTMLALRISYPAKNLCRLRRTFAHAVRLRSSASRDATSIACR